MLQRPTPIILAKPGVKAINQEPESPRGKDENLKPAINQANKLAPKVVSETSAKNGLVKPQATTNQAPILANLSTNSQSPASVNRYKPAQTQLKDPSLTSITPAPNVIEPLNVRLNTGPFMNKSVKLLDENLQWQDDLSDFLNEQTDFLVVGVLGKKGAGKSTLMSMLAANGSDLDEAKTLFKTEMIEDRETAQHRSDGVRAFISTERTIFLDVQVIQIEFCCQF